MFHLGTDQFLERCGVILSRQIPFGQRGHCYKSLHFKLDRHGTGEIIYFQLCRILLSVNPLVIKKAMYPFTEKERMKTLNLNLGEFLQCWLCAASTFIKPINEQMTTCDSDTDQEPIATD